MEKITYLEKNSKGTSLKDISTKDFTQRPISFSFIGKTDIAGSQTYNIGLERDGNKYVFIIVHKTAVVCFISDTSIGDAREKLKKEMLTLGFKAKDEIQLNALEELSLEEEVDKEDISNTLEIKEILSEDKDKKGIIVVPTKEIKDLIMEELIGQFSDGHWSNGNNKTWKYLDFDKVLISNTLEAGVYFSRFIPHDYKNYGTNNSSLKEVIGGRMIGISLASQLVDNVGRGSGKHIKDLGESILRYSSKGEEITQELIDAEVKHMYDTIKRYEGEQKTSTYYTEQRNSFEKFMKDKTLYKKTSKLLMAVNARRENAKLTKNLKEVALILKNPKSI